MFHPEDRRKGSTINIKSALGSNSQNSLMAALQKKRHDLSKQKNRYQNAQCRVKTTHSPQNVPQFDPRGSAIINFRNIKNTQNTQKVNRECVQIKVKPKVVSEPSNGIQINLNIQNLPSNHKASLNEVLSDRSLSHKKRQQQNSKKLIKKNSRALPSNNAIDDFGCNQELQIRIERRTQKKFVTAPYMQKNKSEKLLQVAGKFKNSEVDQYQRLIKQFQMQSDRVNTIAQAEAVSYLDARHICYQIDPQYIEKQQKNFNWSMRAILMDWMMHISYEFRLKRETLHIALAIVDNYFQVACNLSKADFQLTGAASLFIAAKLQQFQPLSSKQFAKSTKQRYSAEQIKLMEISICKSLKYNLNPPTINMWANKIMQQWDQYLENTEISQQPFFENHPPLFFKKIEEECYKNYRQMMQILDCAILDIQTVQYKPKVLVCSLLYLVLGIFFLIYANNLTSLARRRQQGNLHVLHCSFYNRVLTIACFVLFYKKVLDCRCMNFCLVYSTCPLIFCCLSVTIDPVFVWTSKELRICILSSIARTRPIIPICWLQYVNVIVVSINDFQHKFIVSLHQSNINLNYFDKIQVTYNRSMNIVNLSSELKFINSIGQTLSPEQRISLDASVLKLRQEYKYQIFNFWGRVEGVLKNYYIVEGINFKDAINFPIRKYFWSNEDFKFAELPQPRVKYQDRVNRSDEYFTGQHQKIIVKNSGDSKVFNIAGEDGFLKTKNFTELDRLSCIVHQINHDCQIVPVGAFKLIPTHQLVRNPNFRGLKIDQSKNLDNYVHLRAPVLPQKRLLVESDKALERQDFLDPISQDLVKKCWSLQTDQSKTEITLRNLVWPGYVGYHRTNSHNFGGAYFGNGIRSQDLAFII